MFSVRKLSFCFILSKLKKNYEIQKKISYKFLWIFKRL